MEGTVDFGMICTALISALSSSGVMTIVLYILQRRDKLKDEARAKDSAESKMLLGLGHDRILMLTDKYVRRGGITLKEKRNLEYLYPPYLEMNGNGDCKIGYDACQDLPIISEEDAEIRDSRHRCYMTLTAEEISHRQAIEDKDDI